MSDRHILGSGSSYYLFLVSLVSITGVSIWLANGVLSFGMALALDGGTCLLSSYIFLVKRIGAKFCGVRLYKGPLFDSGRSVGKSDLRVCNKCGECQQNVGRRGPVDQWAVVTFDGFVKEIAEAEEWAKKDAEEKREAIQREKDEMIERARQEERERIGLEESRKKALRWLSTGTGKEIDHA